MPFREFCRHPTFQIDAAVRNAYDVTASKAVLATIVRDVEYGVSFGLAAAKGVGSFKLDPFATTPSNRSFAWAIGQLAIEYNPPSRACFTLPVDWSNGIECTVTGLAANKSYKATTTSGGVTHNTVTIASDTGVVQLRLLLKALDSTCFILVADS